MTKMIKLRQEYSEDFAPDGAGNFFAVGFYKDGAPTALKLDAFGSDGAIHHFRRSGGGDALDGVGRLKF